MVTTITIQDALRLNLADVIFVDTRSPKEFAADHLPHAINIPLFSDQERAMVGLTYKQNRVEAYQKGFEIYNQKVVNFIAQFKKLDSKKKLIIYCWRGGMRSKTIAQLVSEIRKNVFQLIGGYKKFREVVREELYAYIPPFKLIVLQSLAGCGKTDIIKKISPSIDLEGFAQHRSSLFGGIGLHPVNQKSFENSLWQRLGELKNESVVFIEGEAKKIGNLFVPENLFAAMQDSPTVHLYASIKNRAKRIVRDYFTHGEDKKIKEIITSLKVFLSAKVVEELVVFVDEKKYEEVATILLEVYYDKQYSHALKDKKYVAEICSDDISLAVKELELLY